MTKDKYHALDYYFGRKHEKKQVSARNIFGLNYYSYLCNSKLDKARDSLEERC